MKVSKNVNPAWAFGLTAEVTTIAKQMFAVNSIFFFEKLSDFLAEFREIDFFSPDKFFFEELKKKRVNLNKFFEDVLVAQMYNRENEKIPIFFNRLKTRVRFVRNDTPVGEIIGINGHTPAPIAEQYFWAMWYLFVFTPQMPISYEMSISPIKENQKYCLYTKISPVQSVDVLCLVVLEFDGHFWKCDMTKVDEGGTTIIPANSIYMYF
jgi:hypothetical protein